MQVGVDRALHIQVATIEVTQLPLIWSRWLRSRGESRHATS